MALRFTDGFDHYDNAHLSAKWTFFPSSSADAGTNTASARNGGQCLQVTRNGVAKTVDNISTWIVGGAFRWDNFGGGVKLIDVATTMTSWAMQGDGTIIVSGPLGSLGQTTPTQAVTLNKYYYIEMKTALHSSTGTVEIRINGQSALLLTGKNTSSTNNADVVNLVGPGGGVLMFVDDFYVCDASGATNNTFLGDVQVGLLKPRAEGNKLEWTPNGTGTVHFSRVNEVPPDDDTSYVFSTMTGTLTSGTGSGPSDLYVFDTVTSGRLVLGIQTNIIARKDDEGNRALTVLTSNASTISQADPTGRYVNLTYIDYLNQFDVNPIGGGSWTPTVMNTMQWGVEVVV